MLFRKLNNHSLVACILCSSLLVYVRGYAYHGSPFQWHLKNPGRKYDLLNICILLSYTSNNTDRHACPLMKPSWVLFKYPPRLKKVNTYLWIGLYVWEQRWRNCLQNRGKLFSTINQRKCRDAIMTTCWVSGKFLNCFNNDWIRESHISQRVIPVRNKSSSWVVVACERKRVIWSLITEVRLGIIGLPINNICSICCQLLCCLVGGGSRPTSCL